MATDPFAELKRLQSDVWGLGPYERVGASLAEAHEHLIARLAPAPGERWLDVATGTGEVARRAAAAGADVTALDLAPVLVETGRRLAAEQGVDVAFDVGDAEALPYADAAFDVVVSTFGAMFAPRHEVVARELARVCRPGGRLGLLTWRSGPGVQDFFGLLGRFGPPPPEGAGNPFDWGSPEGVEKLLGDEFELAFEEGVTTHHDESPETYWALMSSSFGPTKALVANLDPDRRAELSRAWADFFGAFVGEDGRLAWPRPYLLVLGRKR